MRAGSALTALTMVAGFSSVHAFFLTVDGSEKHYSYVLITCSEDLTRLPEEVCVYK